MFGARRRTGASAGRATLEAQLALDDLQYENTSGATRYPNRWALTVAGFGPLGRALGWRAFYTQASSLAFRTLDPFENFTDAGVGHRPQLRRHGPAHRSRSACRAAPRWLLTPELTLLRQGEGEINDPFPATPAEAGQTPADLHRRRGAHLARGAGPARPRRARSTSASTPGCITSSTRTIRRAAPWIASRDGSRPRSGLSRRGVLR